MLLLYFPHCRHCWVVQGRGLPPVIVNAIVVTPAPLNHRRRPPSLRPLSLQVTDPIMVGNIKRWAAELSHTSRRCPGVMKLQKTTPNVIYKRFSASAARASSEPSAAAAAAASLPVRMGSWLLFNLAGEGRKANRRDVFAFAPDALGRAFEGSVTTSRGPDLDVRLSLPRGSSAAAREAPLPYVWVHSAPDGRRDGGGLLSGIPSVVRQIVPESLIKLLSPPVRASEKASVFLSVVRWRGEPLLRAALEAAFRFAVSSAETNTYTYVVQFPAQQPPGNGGRGRGGRPSDRPVWVSRSSASKARIPSDPQERKTQRTH